MKTFLLPWALIVLVLFFCPPGFAGSARNVSDFPDAKKFLVGYEANFINEKDVNEYDDKWFGWILKSDQHFAKFSYGVNENVCLDLRLGKATLPLTTPNTAKDPGMEFGDGFAWGYGLRTKIFKSEDKNWVWGAGFQYNRYNPEGAQRNLMTFDCEPWDWQVSVDINKKLNEAISVFGGMEYSDIKIPYHHPSRLGTRRGGFEAVDNFGIFLGGEVRFLKLSCFIEGHFLDEQSVSCGAGYRF